VVVEFEEPGAAQVAADRVVQRTPCRRVVERLAFAVDRRYTLQRKQDRRRAGRRGKLAAEVFADPGVFVRRCPHQRDVVVVLVEVAILELRRHRVQRPEVDHVGGADRDHLRRAGLGGGRKSPGPGREDAADQFVGQFGGGDVEHAGNQALADQRLHRLAAGAGAVKHEHLIAGLFEHFSGTLNAGRGNAEHRSGDQRLVGGCRIDRELDHAGHRMGRFGQHGAADAVEPKDVDDRVDHHDVFVADEGTHVAGGQGADHHLGHSQRQRAHDGGADRSTRPTADGQYAGDFSLGVVSGNKGRGAGGGVRDGQPPIIAAAHLFERSAGRLKDLLAGDVARECRFAEASGVDNGGWHSQRVEPIADVTDLGSLSVEGSEQVDVHDGLQVA